LDRQYEFYLIGRLNEVMGKLDSAPEEDKMVLLNIFDENMESLVQYKNLH
jgi:hypothetical protein